MTVPAVIGCILLGLLGLILLLPACPVFVRLTFYGELGVTVYVLGIPVYRYSSAEEKEQPPKDTLKADKLSAGKKENPLSSLGVRLKEDGVAATLQYVKKLADIAVSAFKRVLAALTVDRLMLQLFVASGEAADTAQNTGKVCAVLYPALTAIQYVLRIRKRAVTVTPDFLATAGKAEADVLLHAVPYRLLWAAVRAWLDYKKWSKQVTTNTIEEEQQHG